MELSLIIVIMGIALANGWAVFRLLLRTERRLSTLEEIEVGTEKLALELRRANELADQRIEKALNSLFERVRAVEDRLAKIDTLQADFLRRLSQLARKMEIDE